MERARSAVGVTELAGGLVESCAEDGAHVFLVPEAGFFGDEVEGQVGALEQVLGAA